MDPPGQHCQSTEWFLHCSMLSFRFKGRWTPPWSILSEHRVISSLFNVVIQIQRQMDPLCAKHCQSTEFSLHCSMLSFRLKGRWTPQSTLSEYRVISSLFNVVIQTQRQMDTQVNTVRAQSDLFTVQCCHSDSEAYGPPWSNVSEQSYLFTVQRCHSDSKADGAPMCKTLPEHRVISSLFNIVIQTQRQMDPLVNIVRAQSDLFTVQCCHSDSKADGHPSQHCQSTEWSLHCSMLSFRLKGRGTPPVNTVRAQSYLFTVQCCHWDPKADGPHQSTLSEHRVISSLFNVVIETQRQTAPPVNTVRTQSDLFTVQCFHSDSKAEEPLQNTVRAQSDLFTVQCCHSDSKADEPLAKHSQRTGWSLHCSMLSLRLTCRWTTYVQNTARAQSDLFTVQCCHSDSKADETHGQHCQSTEWSLHCSMLSFRLKGRWTPPSQHCQSTELSLHCSMMSLRLKVRGTPLVNTVRAQSDLFTVQCCHSDSKADGPPFNTVKAQSDLFTVHCFHSDSKAHGPPQSTLSEHIVISSLFNVVIQTQRQVDPPGQHCQSPELSLNCSMLSLRLTGRWTPQSTLSEHRVISSLFNVTIETERQMDNPKTLSEHRLISSMFNVVIQAQRQMDSAGQHCQSTELSPHCSMLSFRLKGRWTPQSTWSELRVISSLFNVVIQSQRQMDPPSTLSEHRVISSLFSVVNETQSQMEPPWSTLSEHRVISSLLNVVIQTLRQMDPLVNTVRAQSVLFTIQCCHWDSKAEGAPSQHCQSTEWYLHCSMLSFRLKGRGTPLVNTVRAQSDLFTVQCCHWDSKADGPPSHHGQSTELSLHCSMLSFRLKGRWTPYVQNTARAQSYLFTVQCCHSESKADGPPCSTLSEHRVISSLFNVVIQSQRQMDPPKHC